MINNSTQKKERSIYHCNNTEFKKLILENPDLPILFFVDSEISCCYEYSYTVASGSCEIGEYLSVVGPNDERIYISRDELYTDVKEQYDAEWSCTGDLSVYGNSQYEKINKAFHEYDPYWVKCIIVRVDDL